LRQGSSAQSEDLLRRLCQANGIIEKALPVNQNSRLTPTQRLYLLRETAQNTLIALILLPIAIWSIVYFLPEAGFWGISFLWVIVFFTILFILKIRGLLRDFKRQKVHTISGRVTKRILHENDPETANTYLSCINTSCGEFNRFPRGSEFRFITRCIEALHLPMCDRRPILYRFTKSLSGAR
jgi:hypothetical protein